MLRRDFSTRVRIAAYERCGGKCEQCGSLLKPGAFIYNHRIADYLGGEPSLDNCEVLCRSCDLARTFGEGGDIKKIAKTRRIRKREAGIRKPRKITAWKLFDGSIRRMAKERDDSR
jgi:5-methylcytosine-specific restriction endonuclease McrA